MSYYRILPRDLFNEAKLLKCLGKLIVLIEDRMIDGLTYDHGGDPFKIRQSDSDGSIFIANISFFKTNQSDSDLHFYTALNSKDAWPLRLSVDDNDIEVFTDNGDLSGEFIEFINQKRRTIRP